MVPRPPTLSRLDRFLISHTEGMYGYALERGQNSTSSDNHSNHLTVSISKTGRSQHPSRSPLTIFTRIPNYLNETIILSWLARQCNGLLRPLYLYPSASPCHRNPPSSISSPVTLSLSLPVPSPLSHSSILEVSQTSARLHWRVVVLRTKSSQCMHVIKGYSIDLAVDV